MANKSERTIRTISFNLSDSYEQELLEFALKQQKYFSRYVKRLIEQDRARQQSPVVSNQTIIPVDTEDESDQEDVSGFL